ncbi:CRISPR-associated helicase Cas3 [Novosphingobium sp. FSW06-99]|nr:CRISPR-associated helicase Cas3 [Novosphingobium sp. FSW06-99]
MLDVAAVAVELLAVPGLGPGHTLARDARDALVLLTALHDLGKINPRFRAMLLQGDSQGTKRHWEVSEAYLCASDIQRDLAAHLDCSRFALEPLASATAGHHGRPARIDKQSLKELVAGQGAGALDDARALVAALCALWPDARLTGWSAAQARALSWWFAGLVTVADWIGSNPDWFAPCAPGPDLAAYWRMAQTRAAFAVTQTGLLPPGVVDRALFDFALRPMQQAASRVPLPDGPTLVFVEDETGAGKTEAALILAQRMLLAGHGAGLFFALPSMATADAMFARVEQQIGRMFVAPPSLALAHGRAALSARFRALRDRAAVSDDVVCGEWIGDNRRRALLATIGVGTVDQALLAALPTRFATLRHWGLAGKILIVDEVHELGDAYMDEELRQLLRLHAMAGGSAILITATLPRHQRMALAQAFAQGAGQAMPIDDDPAYPALTVAGGAALRDFPPRLAEKGVVGIERLGSVEAALDCLAEAAGRGVACVWVRNAVDDAIAAREALRARGIEADLLHARYALCDRKRIEARQMARFGRDGDDRAGRVLIGTQVLESSLDLDFDVMISDLAPMAALIQRAGRLWRHMARRPAPDRPVPAPVLHVVSPDPAQVEDARWLQALQPGGAFVYPVADQWRTADTLFRAGQIVAPADLRGLIEAVHGTEPGPIPTALDAAEQEADGERMARASHGRQNVIKLGEGYRGGGGGEDDREYPTRLGRETRTLLLLRPDHTPWAQEAGASMIEREALSEVSVAASRLRGLNLPGGDDPAWRALTADWPGWRRASVTPCVVGDDGVIVPGLRYRADTGLILG